MHHPRHHICTTPTTIYAPPPLQIIDINGAGATATIIQPMAGLEFEPEEEWVAETGSSAHCSCPSPSPTNLVPLLTSLISNLEQKQNTSRCNQFRQIITFIIIRQLD